MKRAGRAAGSIRSPERADGYLVSALVCEVVVFVVPLEELLLQPIAAIIPKAIARVTSFFTG